MKGFGSVAWWSEWVRHCLYPDSRCGAWATNRCVLSAGLRGPNPAGVTIIIGGDMGGQHSGQRYPGLGDSTSTPMLGMAPTGLVGAPSALVSPQIAAALGPESEPSADPDSDNAVASAPIAPRPYGTPVPGGVLIGADISMQIRVQVLQ